MQVIKNYLWKETSNVHLKSFFAQLRLYGTLILLDIFKRYGRFVLSCSQSTRMKKSKTKQNKKYISKEKHKFSFIINVYRKTICTRSWGCQRSICSFRGQCYCEFSFFWGEKSFFLQIKSLLDNQLLKRNEKDVDVILLMSRLQWGTRDSSAGFHLMNSRTLAGRSIDWGKKRPVQSFFMWQWCIQNKSGGRKPASSTLKRLICFLCQVLGLHSLLSENIGKWCTE